MSTICAEFLEDGIKEESLTTSLLLSCNVQRRNLQGFLLVQLEIFLLHLAKICFHWWKQVGSSAVSAKLCNHPRLKSNLRVTLTNADADKQMNGRKENHNF